MKDFFKFSIYMCILFIAIYFLIISCMSAIPIEYYEYTDLDNNKGIAKYCTNKSAVRGGHSLGTPYCELENGTIIIVKEYLAIAKGSDRDENNRFIK